MFILNHKVDIIYHAAAYKRVPIVQYHENIIMKESVTIFLEQRLFVMLQLNVARKKSELSYLQTKQ